MEQVVYTGSSSILAEPPSVSYWILMLIYWIFPQHIPGIMPGDLLKKKIGAYQSENIFTFPGGLFAEMAIAKGFYDEITRTGVQLGRLLPVLLAPHKEDDGGVLEGGEVLQFADHRIPVHTGHVGFQEDDRRLMF